MSVNVSEAVRPTPGVGFEYREECRCLRCDGVIGNESIARSLAAPRPSDRAVVQHVRAYCTFCDTVYKFTRELRGGVWQMSGAVALVTSPRARQAFLSRLAKLRGDVQRGDGKRRAG